MLLLNLHDHDRSAAFKLIYSLRLTKNFPDSIPDN